MSSHHFMNINDLGAMAMSSVVPSIISSWRGHGGRVVTLSPPTSEVGGSIPVTALSGKAGSCLLLVGSLQYKTLANSIYWFPLPFQLPIVI